jgi:hypothetical protein
VGDKAKTVIAHISDLHCGSVYFIPSLAMRVVDELNALEPDVVIITGDLTDAGFRGEYRTARTLIDQIQCPRKLVLPGNHDARNVGDVHFEDYFGARSGEMAFDGVRILTLDSSEPDLDSGRIGRERYRWVPSASPTLTSSRWCACTTTSSRCRAPAASATSSPTPATSCLRCPAPVWTWCCAATSTSRTAGGWRTS